MSTTPCVRDDESHGVSVADRDLVVSCDGGETVADRIPVCYWHAREIAETNRKAGNVAWYEYFDDEYVRDVPGAVRIDGLSVAELMIMLRTKGLDPANYTIEYGNCGSHQVYLDLR